MKNSKRLAPLFLIAGLAGCDSIGDGNTAESLSVVLLPAPLTEQGVIVSPGTPDEELRMYTCFCSNVGAVARFSDGTLSNFSFRATFTSDRPDIVEVRNFGDGSTELCPAIQQVPGLLIPKSVGTANITVEFAGLRDSLKVVVGPTDPGTFAITAVDPLNTDLAVAVGATLPLRVDAVIDGRPRFLNANVTSWAFDPPLDRIATIEVPSLAVGVGVDNGDPQTLKASFAPCGASTAVDLRVGRIAQLTVAKEPDFAPDELLAANSQEVLQIRGALDFDGDNLADGSSQILNQQISLSFTDSCTLREYAVSAPNGCLESPRDDCAGSLPRCASDQTSCSSGMAACRVGDPKVVVASGSRILALADASTPTKFSAMFPQLTGQATTLAQTAPAGSTFLTLSTALVGYPTVFPWEAVVGGEAVFVTGATDATVTLDQPTAQEHLAGAAFAQRQYSSTIPLEVTGDGRTLTSVAIDEPVGPLQALDTLQVHATGTFSDTDGTDPLEPTRTQRITQLSAFAVGSPALVWSSSDTSVANVLSQTGFINSTGACGGRAVIRARATTGSSLTASFDAASNADDLACVGAGGADPLCDQVEICVNRASPLPPGVTCEDPAPAPC